MSSFNTFMVNFFQENVDCDFEFVTTGPAAMVSLIDKQAQQLLVSAITGKASV